MPSLLVLICHAAPGWLHRCCFDLVHCSLGVQHPRHGQVVRPLLGEVLPLDLRPFLHVRFSSVCALGLVPFVHDGVALCLELIWSAFVFQLEGDLVDRWPLVRNLLSKLGVRQGCRVIDSARGSSLGRQPC